MDGSRVFFLSLFLLVNPVKQAMGGIIQSGTALVLSGGGAKGVFEVGVLQGICNKHVEWKNSWRMILGTSIGALNAGILAQFPADKQCEEGVPALQTYWNSVKSQDDVFISSKLKGKDRRCLSVLNIPFALDAFNKYGGLCDPVSGETSYDAAVKKERIHKSGMKLRVVSSDMYTGEPHWFTEKDDHIVDGCMASGSIAPLVYPKEVPKGVGHWYVDGGLFANTPIMKALDDGIENVLVILLETIDGNGTNITNFPQARANKQAGKAVLDYYLAVVNNRVFLRNELMLACTTYPWARIHGYMPVGSLGDLTDFSEQNLQKLLVLGEELSSAHDPIDLCAAAGINRPFLTGRDKYFIFWLLISNVLSGVVSLFLGAYFMKRCGSRWSSQARSNVELMSDAS